MSNLSPLAPECFPDLPPVGGVQLATLAAGLRYTDRDDLMAAHFVAGTVVAGTLTRSLCPSAPIDWCKAILPGGVARALVVNAGNANAFTGGHGATAAQRTAVTMADVLGIEPDEVFLASTGVIGDLMPTEDLTAAIPTLASGFGTPTPQRWLEAANAIRTTDTFAKGAGTTIMLRSGTDPGSDVVPVHVAGFAKGSGMIAPDMATMLAFVFTDAAITAGALQAMVSNAVERSFNRITVDSDTSTSDTALVFATGTAGNTPIAEPFDDGHRELADALDTVMLDLAHQIVRDGEGATKFVEVRVTGAEHDDAAAVIALAIGNSPLVKTALAASDANWGRIVMAVGKAGQKADRDALAVWIGDEAVADKGLQCDDYSEARATEHLQGEHVVLTVDVGVGTGAATIWTCDLTHGYIDINAGYRS